MTQVENSGHWQCVPKIENYDEDWNELQIIKIYKFGALWWLKARKVKEDGEEYCKVRVETHNNWNGRTVMNGTMQLKYGIDRCRSIQFDIKEPMEFNKFCKWYQLVDMAKNDTKLSFVIRVDEHFGINFRRTWTFDNNQRGITDGSIVCKNQAFDVSKAILSLHSPFFYERFRKTSIIDLPDLDGATMKVILDMLHPPYLLPKDWCEHAMDWETDVPIYKEEPEKRALTNKRYILKIAQLLKLKSVEQICRAKIDRDGRRKRSRGWNNGLPFVEMAEAIDDLRFQERSRSLDNCELPVKMNNTIREVFDINDINDKKMIVKFTNMEWKFELVNEQSDEQFVSIQLLDPWVCKPFQVTGTINLVYNGSKVVEMTCPFVIPFSEKQLYIGKLSKELMLELDATITITIIIEKIDVNWQFRKWIDYNTYHDGISTGKVIVDGETFNVSKELLSYHSPVLHKMFVSSSELHLDDISAAEFRCILDMIYPTMLMPGMECTTKLLEFAHKYDVEFVKERIVEDMRLLVVKDIGWNISASDRFDMPNLMRDIGPYSWKEVEEFMTTGEYSLLSENMKKYLNDLTVAGKKVDQYWQDYEKELKESGKSEKDIKLELLILKMKE